MTDMAGNMSNLLLVSSFEVDRLLLSLETRLQSSVLQDEHLLVTQNVIDGKAPFEFRVDNLPEWLVLDTGTGQIKGTPGATDIETYSDIVIHITDSEERVAKSVAFELRVIDVNDSPIAENDTFTLIEGGKGLINVLANDSDPDEGDLITIDSVSSVFGDVTIVGDMLEYQTPIDFVGDDIISYTIVDSGGLTATAEEVVSITYDPEPNDARWVEGLTAGDWCVKLTIKDGGPNDVDGLANGMVVDPGGLARLSGPIVSDNHDPVAKDDFYQLINAEQIELDVLDNDSDPDGDLLSLYKARTDSGQVEVSDNRLIVTPDKAFVGEMHITYFIVDPSGAVAMAMAMAKVTVTVKEGEKVSVENSSGGTVSLSLFLLLLIFIQRYLFTLSLNERSHFEK